MVESRENHRVSIVANDSRVEVFLLVSNIFGDSIRYRRRDQRYGVGGYFTSRRHVRVRCVRRHLIFRDRPDALSRFRDFVSDCRKRSHNERLADIFDDDHVRMRTLRIHRG